MAYIPDIIVVDRGDRPLLIGEVKAPKTIDPRFRTEILARLRGARSLMPGGLEIRYGLLADPSQIDLVDLDSDDQATVWSAKTAEVLRPYAPGFPGNTGVGDRVSHWYLEGMIGSWLRDLAYQWKHMERSPGADAFARVGLLDRMKDGWAGSQMFGGNWTKIGASLGSDPIH